MVSRIITGLLLVALVSFLLLFSSTNVFSAFFYIVVFLCTIEWSNINRLKYFGLTFNLLYISLVFLYLFYLAYDYQNVNVTTNFTETLTKLLIDLTPIWAVIFIRTLIIKKDKFSKFFLYFSGFYVFLNFTAAILDIKFNLTNQISTEYLGFLKDASLEQYKSGIILLSIILLTAMNDTGAYFVGKFFGKHKLAKNISPNKTVEGLIGGFVLSIIFSLILYYYIFNFSINVFGWLLIVLALMSLGNLGDLSISRFKRVAKVKDTGSILPGHGGLLDRLDSHLVVIPSFWFFMLNIVF